VEQFISRRGELAAVVRTAEAALACASVGVVAICAGRFEVAGALVVDPSMDWPRQLESLAAKRPSV
jgi:hypothetical protein